MKRILCISSLGASLILGHRSRSFLDTHNLEPRSHFLRNFPPLLGELRNRDVSETEMMEHTGLIIGRIIHTYILHYYLYHRAYPKVADNPRT